MMEREKWPFVNPAQSTPPGVLYIYNAVIIALFDKFGLSNSDGYFPN